MFVHESRHSTLYGLCVNVIALFADGSTSELNAYVEVLQLQYMHTF